MLASRIGAAMGHVRAIPRREFAKLATAAAAGPFLPSVPTWVRPSSFDVPRWPGYEDAMVIDCLASPGPFNVVGRMDNPLTQAMLDNVIRSGITGVNVTVSGGGPGHSAFDGTVRSLAYWEREAATHRAVLQRIRTAEDIRAAKLAGRLGLILGFQNADMLEGDVARLGLFHDFGVRIIQLTYNLRNDLGDGCLEPGNAGLSQFGVSVVESMNELGILVDLSHCGQRTTAEAIERSSHPIGITHSGCSAVYEHPRSKHDGELRAMADKGGVVGIYMMPFLNSDGPAQLDHFIQHLEHAINVCGEDHVGVGSDNSITPTVADETYIANLHAFADERVRLGIGAPREHEVLFVPDLNTPRRMERIADELLARGHGEATVEKILGANWMRVFSEVWR